MSEAIAASVEHLKPWMSWASLEPLPNAERHELIERSQADWEAGGDAVFGVFLDGAVVGGGGLHRRAGAGVLDIGYWVHVDHVRTGVASELAASLTTAAFEVDGVEHVDIHHDKANVASSGVPRRLGFTLLGESADEATAPAEVGIDCHWRVSRAEWRGWHP